MHEDYDYDDDEYNYDDAQDKYKHYFKFDPNAWDVWGKFLYDSLKDIVESSPNVWYIGQNIPGFPSKSIPVNGYFSNTGQSNFYQYLGNNYQGTPVWKYKYFVKDSLNQEYIKHIEKNAVHFLMQPHYYNGMFDILN